LGIQNLRCEETFRICMLDTIFLSLEVSEITALARRRSDGDGYIDSSSDPDQEYIYFMASETPTCLILFTKHNTSNRYKNHKCVL